MRAAVFLSCTVESSGMKQPMASMMPLLAVPSINRSMMELASSECVAMWACGRGCPHLVVHSVNLLNTLWQFVNIH